MRINNDSDSDDDARDRHGKKPKDPDAAARKFIPQIHHLVDKFETSIKHIHPKVL